MIMGLYQKVIGNSKKNNIMELRLPPHIEKTGDAYISKLTRRRITEKNIKSICDLYWKYNPPLDKSIEDRKELMRQNLSILIERIKPVAIKECPICGALFNLIYLIINQNG